MCLYSRDPCSATLLGVYRVYVAVGRSPHGLQPGLDAGPLLHLQRYYGRYTTILVLQMYSDTLLLHVFLMTSASLVCLEISSVHHDVVRSNYYCQI